LRIRGHDVSVPCLVCTWDAHEVILGEPFLARSNAALFWETKTAHFKLNGQAFKVAMTECTEPNVPVVSAAVGIRWVKGGGVGFLVLPEHISALAEAIENTEVKETSMAEHHRKQRILNDFSDVFPDELPSGLPPPRNISHAIPMVNDSVPPTRPMYRSSPAERAEVVKTLEELLIKGFIEPSTSPFASPILFVRKKEGTLRMVIDYRGINKLTKRNQYPLPRIDDLLDHLNGAQVFSSLDLMSGYHQVQITEEDIPKTAVRTPQGLYQFKVLPFGLTNAPATFQKVMNDVLQPLLGKCVLVYMDDILVYSKNAAEHEEHLCAVLQLLREHKLNCKLKKCSFFQSEVAFLGHLVSGAGVRADPQKVEAVRAWPAPRTVHDIRCFLGLTNYFRKFILWYSSIARPLMDLLKDQVPWAWT
jgi:hypothetical protein